MAYKGIDVSHYQGTINWSAVKKDGIYFAFVKATEGSADGTAFVDPNLTKNVKGAHDAGIKVGVYHYAKFVSVNDAKNEVDWFIKHIKSLPMTLPAVLDLEENNCPSDKIMNDGARAFLQKVEDSLGSALLYSFGDFFDKHVDKTLLKDFAYWHARYNSDPVNLPLSKLYAWQHTDAGRVSGISGNVDLNTSGGNFFLSPQSKTTPQVTYYTVKKDDTAWGIAQAIHTTVSTLQKLNPSIKDMDKIFPGQKMRVK